MIEQIHDIGYVNEQQKHCLISISNPPLVSPGPNFLQLIITIEGAMELRAQLNAFLLRHGAMLQ